jgi:hypothetical protein
MAISTGKHKSKYSDFLDTDVNDFLNKYFNEMFNDSPVPCKDVFYKDPDTLHGDMGGFIKLY